MTTINANNNKTLAVAKFVREYVERNGRGCPKGELQWVGKFTARDIKHAIEMRLVETARGSEGGLFPAGLKPSPKAKVNVTLKSRMADLLRTIDSNPARQLVAEYEEECSRRSKAQLDE